MKKICLVGSHGTGKSKICESVLKRMVNKKNYNLWNNKEFKLTDSYDRTGEIFGFGYNFYDYLNEYLDIKFIPEQFREIVTECNGLKEQTEEITLATYAKQLYLENLYTAQGKNILCDRSVLDTFIYYNYFNKYDRGLDYLLKQRDTMFGRYDDYNDDHYDNYGHCYDDWFFRCYVHKNSTLAQNILTYSKIYLIEPSDREIEPDGFRMIDKKQQLEIHQLFLEYFKGFKNVEIINQEEAHKEEFIEKVTHEINP